MQNSQAILVVGGAGYIGSHVCRALNREGFQLVVVDNLSRGFRKAVRWGTFYHGDMADTQLLDTVFRNHSICAVMDFAALAYVGESVDQPDLYYANNVAKTVSLLSSLLRHNVNKFVFSSSCATFGEAEYLPIDERHPQNPINPYGHSKLMVEQILKDYDKAFGLNSMVFRYFNAAGCDSSGEIGENHDPETHVIPLILRTALGMRKQFSIFGSDYDTPDGTCIRDYIHVEDLASAHLLGLKALLNGGSSDQFNLGVGEGLSVQELIRAAERITGKTIPIAVQPRRAGDPARLVGSSEKVERLLGWKARSSSVDNILRTAWAWQSRRASN